MCRFGTPLLVLVALAGCKKKARSAPEPSQAAVTVRITLPGGATLRPELRASFPDRRAPLGAQTHGAPGVLLAYPRPRALGVSLATTTTGTDVVLLDHEHKILRVAARQPPRQPARVDVIPDLYQYGLVLPAGAAARLGLKPGLVLPFELPVAARPARVLTPVTLQPPARSAVTVLSELAIDPEETSMGLMYRRTLPPKGGMLFRFPRPQVLWFYMKNTRVPLDMIFLDDQRRVTGVVHRATPYDERTVGVGPVPNRYVLEVRAGFAQRHGIVEGTRASFRIP